MSFLSSKKSADLGLLVLRSGTGGLMLFHGVHKVVNGHGFIKRVLAEKGLPELLWLGVPIAEVLAPALLILGIFSRISAILISIVMAFSIYLAFGTSGFEINKYGGLTAEFNIYFIFVGLALFLTGPGSLRLGSQSRPLLQ